MRGHTKSQRSRIGGAVLAVLLLICVPAASTGAAESEATPPGEVSEVEIYLPSPANHQNVLSLRIYPAEGVAVAHAYFPGKGQSERAVSYAIAIPKRSFDGSLNLDFPGIGEVVGTVTPTKVRRPVGQAKVCEARYPSESATFEGHLSISVARGYERFAAKKVQASIDPFCGASPRRGSGPRWLFAHMNDGPGFMNDFIRFFAHRETKRRRVEFVVVGDRRDDHGTLIGFDHELLPGGIATQRWVKRSPVPFEPTVHLAGDADHPSRLTFTPPAPFFGRAVFERRTGRLTGSLGVRFPGLTLRLTHPSMAAVLEDEERGTA